VGVETDVDDVIIEDDAVAAKSKAARGVILSVLICI